MLHYPIPFVPVHLRTYRPALARGVLLQKIICHEGNNLKFNYLCDETTPVMYFYNINLGRNLNNNHSQHIHITLHTHHSCRNEIKIKKSTCISVSQKNLNISTTLIVQILPKTRHTIYVIFNLNRRYPLYASRADLRPPQLGLRPSRSLPRAVVSVATPKTLY